MRHAHLLTRLTLTLVAATMLCVLPACGDDSAEDLGEKVDDAVDEAKDEAEDAKDAAEDLLDEHGK